PYVTLLIIIAAATGAAWLGGRVSAGAGFFAALLGAGALAAAAWWAFAARGVWLPMVPPLAGAGAELGVHVQHRRLASRGPGPHGRARHRVPDAGPHLAGLVRGGHHVVVAGPRSGVLGRSGPPAGHQPVVHGLVGGLGLRGPLRRTHDAKRRLALEIGRASCRERWQILVVTLA